LRWYGLVQPGAGHASTIAQDSFSYAAGELNGQNGGVGFAGAWTANVVATEVADPGVSLSYAGGATVVDGGSSALRITGNNNNLAFRDLAVPVSLDEIFVSFLFRYEGALDTNDFGVLWHDNVSTGTHTTRPNLGIKANQGNGSGTEDVVARLQLSGTGQVYAVDLVAGQTYFILGRLSKSAPGVGSAYDEFDVWVNPTAGASGTPDLTATGSGGISSFGTIGVRTANIDALDEFWIDELKYATTFATAVPEPTTATLLAFGLLAGTALGTGSRRRTNR
jgi:hypothetical protein